MIHLNRAALKNRLEFIDTEHISKVAGILQYINDNLTDDLNIDHISSTFFVSKYYMMRQFKQETGYTLGNYISRKRLLLAKELILSGVPEHRPALTAAIKTIPPFQELTDGFSENLQGILYPRYPPEHSPSQRCRLPCTPLRSALHTCG